MNLGPGALSQSGSSQGLHPQGSLSDTVSTGLPPASLMQGQIGNGEQVCGSDVTKVAVDSGFSGSLHPPGLGTVPSLLSCNHLSPTVLAVGIPLSLSVCGG